MSVVYLCPPPGKETAPSPYRASRPSVSLTPSERAGLRLTLKNLRAAHGSWAALARLFGVSEGTVRKVAHGRTRGSPGLVVLAARLAGVTIDRVITPGPVEPRRCPHCGRPL